MLISKFDLYKTGWLDLVFDDRNKDYGAYDLRHNYANNVVRAMGITFFGVALLCGASIILRPQPTLIEVTQVDNHPDIHIQPPPVQAVKRNDPPKSLRAEPPAHPIATTRDVPPVVVPDPVAE